MARVLVLRQGHVPWDTRVRREIDALVSAGHSVDVICLGERGAPSRERSRGARIWRLPLRRHREGMALYALEHALFLAMASVLAGVLHLRRRYDIVQANSIPDSVVFAAAIPRLLGARVLLDLHECVPEFLATKAGSGMGHPTVRVAAAVEQASIRFAHGAITCTEQMREAFVARGAPDAKIEVVLNAADEAIFDPDRRAAPPPAVDGAFTLVCHGTIEERYGLDTVVRAVALLRDELPGLRLGIYGDGSHRAAIAALVAELGVADRVRLSDGFVPMPELLGAIAQADVGVVAMRRDAFRDLTHCNKMFDLIAMRTPAIVSRTRSVQAYFDESCFAFFDAGDPADLARAIRELAADPARRETLAARATACNEPYRWPRQRETYLRVVSRVLGGEPAPDARAFGHATLEEQLEVLSSVVASAARPGEPLHILEAGCGDRPSPLGVDLGEARVAGIDVSERQLARNDWAHEKILGDLETHPLPPAAYDVVVTWDVLEHLAHPDRALASLAAAVRPGGLLVVKVPNLLSGKGLITKLTPYWFHVWVYRHVFGYPNPGQDDSPPFRTFLRPAIAPPALRRFGRARGLREEMFATWESDKQLSVRRRYRLTGAPWRALRGAVRVLSLGRVAPEATELIAVFRRP